MDYNSGQWPFCLNQIGDWTFELIDKTIMETGTGEVVNLSVEMKEMDSNISQTVIISLIRVLSRVLLFKDDSFFTHNNINALVKMLDFIPKDAR